MLRVCVYPLPILFVCITAVPVIAQGVDPYFDQDLLYANADPRYAHLTTATEKVRVYRLHNYAPGNWDAMDPNFDGIIGAAAAAKLRSLTVYSSTTAGRKPQPSKDTTPSKVVTSASPTVVSVPTPLQSPVMAKSPQRTATLTNDSTGQWVAYLRKDFTDIYSINAPNSPASSTGATISYSNDQIAKNTIWSGQGAVFGGYNYLAPQFGLNGQPYILGFTAGPYYTWNATFNSNSADASKNTDIQTFGGVAELAAGNFLGVDRFNEFTRVAVGGVQDDVKNTSSLSATADFIPVYDPLLIHYPHFIKTSDSSYFRLSL